MCQELILRILKKERSKWFSVRELIVQVALQASVQQRAIYRNVRNLKRWNAVQQKYAYDGRGKWIQYIKHKEEQLRDEFAANVSSMSMTAVRGKDDIVL